MAMRITIKIGLRRRQSVKTGHGHMLERARSAAPCEHHRSGRAARRLSHDYRAAAWATCLIATQRGTPGLSVRPTRHRPRLQPPPDSGHREAETEQYLPSDIDKCRKLVSSKI